MATATAMAHARQFLQPATAGDPGDPRMSRMTFLQTAHALADMAQQHPPLQASLNGIHLAMHKQSIEASDATEGRNAGFPRIVHELQTPGNHIHGSARLVAHTVLSGPGLQTQLSKLAADPRGYATKIDQAVAGAEKDFASALLATSAGQVKAATYRKRITQAGQDLGQLLTGGELPPLAHLTGDGNNPHMLGNAHGGKLPEGFRLSPLAKGDMWMPKGGYGAENDDWQDGEPGDYQGKPVTICEVPGASDAGAIICIVIVVVVVVLIIAKLA